MDQPSFPPPFTPVSDIGVSGWPRRAAKACASCRRDKIRCDGSRPCSGCVKKGYSADQCIDGCEHCRRARVRCEDGKPCARCREMQLECIDEPNSSIFRSEASPSGMAARPVRTKANDRAKLACQNCRRDNKKCDDTRPCQRCVARSEECVHVGRGPKLVKLRCEACRKDNKKCEDVRPCRSCIEQARECVSVSRRGRGHGTRVKAACTNCRRDKIRCDGVRPCAACTRKGYECLDRACKACTENGIETECTHRKMEAEHEEPRESMNAHASSSHMQHHQMQGQMPPPPMAYPPLGYTVPHHYYPHPAHGHPGPPLPPMVPHPMYTSDPRPGYYPVIDPHIDDPPGRIVSSERTGMPNSDQKN